MKKHYKTPRNYHGTEVTTHKIGDILPSFLNILHTKHQERPDLILEAWSEVIGPQMSKMTQAIAFDNGVLLVKVKNSTLYSLLSQHERGRLLTLLSQRFPHASIRNIIFRMG